MRNGRRTVLPTRPPISCSSPAFCRSWACRGRGETRAGPLSAFAAGFVGALLRALSIFMRPVVAPAAAVLLAGAGLASLGQRQWTRLSGLCLGFLPVFSMALHNWYFGHVFVPLS